MNCTRQDGDEPDYGHGLRDHSGSTGWTGGCLTDLDDSLVEPGRTDSGSDGGDPAAPWNTGGEGVGAPPGGGVTASGRSSIGDEGADGSGGDACGGIGDEGADGSGGDACGGIGDEGADGSGGDACGGIGDEGADGSGGDACGGIGNEGADGSGGDACGGIGNEEADAVSDDDRDATDAESGPEEHVSELAALTAERDAYIRDLQRITAEFANFRRQITRRNRAVVAQAASHLVETLLPVLDACEAAVSQDVDGIAALQSQLIGVLEDEGLSVIGDEGEAFDPNRHEAVVHEPPDDGTEAEAEPVVAAVLRTGYAWKSKVLRPAMVKVRG